MQFQTSSSNYSGNGTSPKRRLFITGLLFILLVAFVFLALRVSRDDEFANSGEYFDPVSGETVSDPPDKAPETYGALDSQPVFLGFSKLVDKGVTQFQLDAAKDAFIAFSPQFEDEEITEVSVDVSTIKTVLPNPSDESAIRSVSFDVVLNRGPRYQAVLRLIDIRSAELILSQSGKEVFRSGVINTDEHGD